MEKHKCVECKQPITEEEYVEFKGLCNKCMAYKINQIRKDAKRNLESSPH